MSEPKMPSWMIRDDRSKHRGRWFSGKSVNAIYYEGEDTVWLSGDLTAEELRELADLIDSCQAEAKPK